MSAATMSLAEARAAVTPEPNEDEVVLRIWKRDATKNYMYLKHAIANLAGQLGRSPQVVADAIRGGEMLETPLALWRMATLED